MSTSPPEVFLLLTLPNSTVRTPTITQTGSLDLKCVTIIPPPSSPSTTDREVFLVLNLGTFETPIDPCRVIHGSKSSSQRTYTFDGTEDEPSDLVLTITTPSKAFDAVLEDDLDVFEGILAQYADFRRSGSTGTSVSTGSSSVDALAVPIRSLVAPEADSDLRGKLVLVNEASGELVGSVDQKFNIHEDPILRERGHEDDPVIIEVPEGKELDALEVFARAVPSEEQDWITKSATVISHAISSTTNLVITGITTASTHYMAKSPSSTSAGSSSNPKSPPPLPPRAVALFTSATARKGLSGVHTVSEHAVYVSSKTVSLINGMISRAMGRKGKNYSRTHQMLAPASPRPRAPSSPSQKPDLPPRRVPSPSPTASSSSRAKTPPPPLSPRTLSTKDRLILSVDLILSTLDESARQIIDVGGERLSAVVGHKYGPAAAENTLLATGTVRNVLLVYIDMKGIGRRALLKRAGKEFVKAKVVSKK